jgi:hypothetical protein
MKPDTTITREEFMEMYAKNSKVTVEWLRAYGLDAFPCDCEEKDCRGWQMQNVLFPPKKNNQTPEPCGCSEELRITCKKHTDNPHLAAFGEACVEQVKRNQQNAEKETQAGGRGGTGMGGSNVVYVKPSADIPALLRELTEKFSSAKKDPDMICQIWGWELFAIASYLLQQEEQLRVMREAMEIAKDRTYTEVASSRFCTHCNDAHRTILKALASLPTPQ